MAQYVNFITKDNENFITSDNEQFKVIGTDGKIKVVTFYNKAELIVVDKTNFLEDRTTLYGVFRDDVNPMSFTMELEVDTPINFNYAYLEVFNRYYTVDNVTYINNKLARVSFSVDVLFSFKDAILKQKGFIDRNENGRNLPIVDNKNVIVSGYNLYEFVVDNNAFNIADGTYALTGYGLIVLSS